MNTAPLLVELSVFGSALVEHAPRRLPDLFAGAPALGSVALPPEGGVLSDDPRGLVAVNYRNLNVNQNMVRTLL